MKIHYFKFGLCVDGGWRLFVYRLFAGALLNAADANLLRQQKMGRACGEEARNRVVSGKFLEIKRKTTGLFLTGRKSVYGATAC